MGIENHHTTNKRKLTSLCPVPVNVLAREGEDETTAENVVKKWASKVTEKKKTETKSQDQVVQLQGMDKEGTIIEHDDDEREKAKPKVRQSPFNLVAKFLHIPDRYINNKALFVDVISRGIFPASFVVFNFVFWGIYK